MVVDVVMVRGTSEPFNGENNMLRSVTTRLDRIGAVLECSYPASIGFANQTWRVDGPSEDESIRQGVDNVAQLIRGATNRVGLLGYSLGAIVVSRFLEAQARGEYADCEIAWSACVANPLRREGDSIDARSYGFGINGEHGPFPARPHLEAANPSDAISSCPAGSPLRGLADAVSAFGFAAVGGWTADLVDRLRWERWQPVSWGEILHPIQSWRRYSEAADDVRGYLWGEHTTKYVRDGYCERLAVAINAL